MMRKKTRVSLVSLGVTKVILLLQAPSLLPAVELSELSGDWTFAELSTPTDLRETFYRPDTDTIRIGEDSGEFARPGEFLSDAFYPDPVLAETISFSLSDTGVVTGGETG